MKTLIVYDHPYAESYCHAILDSVRDGIVETGGWVDVIDLHADRFNPVMSEKDLLAFRNQTIVDDQAIDYAARLKNADHLIMIFPIWWELMPAMTKGFIDKVIFPGTTYQYTKSGLGMTSLLPALKSVTVITTMNTPQPVYRLRYGNALQKALLRGTFKKIGCKRVKWISLNMVKFSSGTVRADWLKSLKKRVPR